MFILFHNITVLLFQKYILKNKSLTPNFWTAQYMPILIIQCFTHLYVNLIFINNEQKTLYIL